MDKENDAHDDPLGDEMEDVLEVGQDRIVVGPRLSGSEGVTHQKHDKVADSESLQNPGNSEPVEVDPASEGVEDEAEEEELDRSDTDLPDYGGDGRVPLDVGPDGHGDADAHDPDEPGEDEVGHVETVPCGVLHEPVSTSAVIDKDHDHDGHTTECVQGPDLMKIYAFSRKEFIIQFT